MPVYQVLSPTDLLSDDDRAAIAREITAIHVEHTGGPEVFVNVLFQDVPPARAFVAGEPAAQSYILGQVREGREIEVRQAILRDLAGMWTRITGGSVRDLLLGITEVDPRAVMEAGLIMPAAGQEAAWFRENEEVLSELGITPRGVA